MTKKSINMQRIDRGRSIGGSSVMKGRPSGVLKFREKTIGGVKNKINEQLNQSTDSFNQIA